jgi:hypothetical protein
MEYNGSSLMFGRISACFRKGVADLAFPSHLSSFCFSALYIMHILSDFMLNTVPLGENLILKNKISLNDARYKYVSRLAIKLLEEGFDLQGHLQALRRYYFMESADWADLFIMSLWHHVFLSANHF